MIDMGCVAPWIARGTLVLMRTCVVNSINTCALVNETRTDPPGMLSSFSQYSPQEARRRKESWEASAQSRPELVTWFLEQLRLCVCAIWSIAQWRLLLTAAVNSAEGMVVMWVLCGDDDTSSGVYGVSFRVRGVTNAATKCACVPRSHHNSCPCWNPINGGVFVETSKRTFLW